MDLNKEQQMKTVAVESLVVDSILTFCENAAELGCPRDKDVDMWFRELSYEEQLKVADKMLEIEERNARMQSETEVEEVEAGVEEDKIITMHEIELDLDKDTINKLIEIAKEEIVNDDEALINYAANKALKLIVDTDGECLTKEKI